MKNKNILIVEDEVIVAKDIQNRLEAMNYSIPAIATSGKEAIQKAAETPIDLVLMDIKLRGKMDGIEAAQEIQSRFDIPVIYMTAYSDEATLQRARITEPFGYIVKPVKDRELHASIEMALYKHEAEKELLKQRDLAESMRKIAERRLERIQSLRAVAMIVGGAFDVRATLDAFLDQITTNLNADAVSALLLNPKSKMLEYIAGRGFQLHAINRSELWLNESLAGRAAIKRRIIEIKNWIPGSSNTDFQSILSNLQLEGMTSYHAVPLIVRHQVKGVFEIFHRMPFDISDEWSEFIDMLSLEAAIAVDNARLMTDLQNANTGLNLAFLATLEAWAKTLDEREKAEPNKTLSLANLTMRLARALGVEGDDLVHIRCGALLHDIGNMTISEEILFKAGDLTDSEWEIVRQHPTNAHRMLSKIDYLSPALDIPYCHHEKWDGSGYPRGLEGEQIPLTARIFAVADVWDALNTARPYRDAWPKEKSLSHIKKQAGSHFDPHVVNVFLQLIKKENNPR